MRFRSVDFVQLDELFTGVAVPILLCGSIELFLGVRLDVVFELRVLEMLK